MYLPYRHVWTDLHTRKHRYASRLVVCLCMHACKVRMVRLRHSGERCGRHLQHAATQVRRLHYAGHTERALCPFCVVARGDGDVCPSRDQSFAKSKTNAAVCPCDNDVFALHIVLLSLNNICLAQRRHVSRSCRSRSEATPLERRWSIDGSQHT